MRRFAVVLAFAAVGCGRFSGGCRGDYCGTLIFAAAGQPDILLPPVTESALARDIHDQLFLKLADLGMSTNTIGDRDFTPQLAQRWEWTGPKTLVFHLDPRARWQDGRPVTAGDVAFTFAVYTDPKVGASSRESLRRIASVTARDSLTAVFQFTTTYAEMFYDAVYDMRILPAHLLEHTPREQLSAAPFGRAPIGDGPYRFVSWRAGESIELAADSTFFLGRPHIRRLIWRFSPDLNVAITQLIAGQADAIEVLGPPDNVKRVRQAPDLVVDFYRGSVYGYLAFNLARPVFGDRDVRRAFVMAVDRGAVLQSVFGGGDLAQVPPGPIPQLWPLWNIGIRTLPYDTAQAGRLLAARGWRDANGDGIRDRAGKKLGFDILVPTTSGMRRQYARLLQEQLRRVGVEVSISEVEFNVMQDRLAKGNFDAAILTYTGDPTPSSGEPQHWRRGAAANYGHYASPPFDAALDRAISGSADTAATTAAWRDALSTLNEDAPAIFLFAMSNAAAINRRVADVRIRPDSWWALVRTWRIPADRLIDRDRVEH